MFNPHIHQQQQQQQQQQFHQHLRQLQQLFQQQPPPPPPPQPPPGHHVPHHHQAQRAMPGPPQNAPPPRMVNLCQASQTTIIAPNPMLQGAILMQQMQGNMRSFGMGGQQFRQFFTAGTRSSLLGPVPMGMAIKSPMMGFPAQRPFHPHVRYYNNNNNNIVATTTASSSSSTSFSTSTSSSSTTDAVARLPDRKRDSEQMAGGSTDDQPALAAPPAPPAAAASSSHDDNDKTQTDGAVGGVDGPTQISEEQLEEPAVKKQRTEGSEKPKDSCVGETVTSAETDGDVFSSECNSNTDDMQPEDCILMEDGGSTGGSDVVDTLEETRTDEVQSCLSAASPSGGLVEGEQQVDLPAEETSEDKDVPLASPENPDEEEDGTNKFYCYLCSITCHNQQNFRSHMNSVSHQQRMMEIQHMSNACLVSLLPRVQESLQGVSKDGDKKADLKRWCATCHTHFTSSLTDHRRTEEHKLGSTMDITSCAVCKKRFKTSQIFLEHLQSQEHRRKLQEKGCEALGKLTALDPEGFSLDEEVERGSELGEEEDRQDVWSSLKEVTLNNMASDEQYDPDTVCGSSFLAPVSGFICRLCNKFYHFESSALHTHCKSLKHFENLQKYKVLVSQKVEAVKSSRESLLAADGLGPKAETLTDCSDENLLADNPGSVTDPNSMQPIITLTRLKVQGESQQGDEREEPERASEDFAAISETNTDQDLSLLLEEEEATSQACEAQQGPAELPAGSTEEVDSEPAAAVEDAKKEEVAEEESEAPAPPESEAPAAPESEAPADPESEAPADPESEAPADPESEAPADPESEAPADPESEAPADPESDAPADPESEAPADPEKKSGTAKAKAAPAPKRRSGRASRR
ncbi:cdkn1a interacting zinc finger protein 1a [Embiotoca jacksoni]|uniref:cdkn1a interacting zinc finger protein 1a n=1 Tax=Embiotoca jacksoni TaxID=100190 RepID=UPI003703E6B7